MNCLGSCQSYELNPAESSATPYYPPQLPYNPDFIEEQDHYDQLTDPAYLWSSCDTKYYTGNTFENYDEWGRARRSLYEGVNCMPVSAPACVHRAARYLHQLRITVVCCVDINKTLYIFYHYVVKLTNYAFITDVIESGCVYIIKL